MSIRFKPVSPQDLNYSRVIDLFQQAFPNMQRLPSWILKLRMRKGKKGFDVLYENDRWLGFIYCKTWEDILFVKFFAISEAERSCGYGSKVLEGLQGHYGQPRIVLNIEELDPQADNFTQREKRQAFYEKNGFVTTGLKIKEPTEVQEMLISGGQITPVEIQQMYRHFLGPVLYQLLKPEVTTI